MTITITPAKAIDHNDADAAGFTSGFGWTFDGPFGVVESYAPTVERAERDARAAAIGQGIPEDELEVVKPKAKAKA